MKLHQKAAPKSFFKSMAILSSGVVVSNIIMLATTPIIMLLYSPAQFGVLSVATSIILILGLVNSLSYHAAILLPQDDQDGRALLQLANILCLVFSLVFTCALYVAPFAATFQLAQLQPYYWLIGLSILFLGLLNNFQKWALRFEHYQTVSRSKITMNSSQSLVQIALGVGKISNSGLLIGDTVGRIFGFLSFYRRYRTDLYPTTTGDVRAMKKQAVRYRNFPFVINQMQLMDGLGAHLPVLLIAATFQVEVAGIYFIAVKILTIPASVLGYPSTQVYHTKAAQLVKDGMPLTGYSLETVKKLAVLTVLLIGAINLAVPVAVHTLFSEDWQSVIPMLQILSVAYFIKIVTDPLLLVFQICETYRLNVLAEIIRFLCIAGAVGVSLLVDGTVLQVLGLISLGIVLGNAGSAVVACYVIRKVGTGNVAKHRQLQPE